MFCKKNSIKVDFINHGFKKLFARVAQLVERLTCNEDVAGSTPVSGFVWL